MKVLTAEQFLEQCLGQDVDEVEIDPELKEIQGSARKIPGKEKKRRAEEVKDMDSSDLSKAFGLDS